jgi:hypothetical protein
MKFHAHRKVIWKINVIRVGEWLVGRWGMEREGDRWEVVGRQEVADI